MKTKTLKAYLSILVAFCLALSSCDKKNALLVNRRTATPERIEEIRKNDVLAMFPAALHPLILGALARLPADRQHFIANLDIDLCQRLNVALNTLNNDADRINFIYNFFYFHPDQHQELLDAFNRFALNPDLRHLFIYVLITTGSDRRHFVKHFATLPADALRPRLINIINDLTTLPNDRCHALITTPQYRQQVRRSDKPRQYPRPHRQPPTPRCPNPLPNPQKPPRHLHQPPRPCCQRLWHIINSN